MSPKLQILLGFLGAAVAGFGCDLDECSSIADCPEGLACALGRCTINLAEPKAAHIDLTDGWDDAPGSGLAFVVDTLAIADQGRGFDVDGQCRGPGDCVDNALWQIGTLMNDQIRQDLLGGNSLFIIEIAGIDEPFFGDDERVTVKLYEAMDADKPFFPANNFQIPVGETRCCEFLLQSSSIDPAQRQPFARIRARIDRGRLTSTEPTRMTAVTYFSLFWEWDEAMDVEEGQAATPPPRFALSHASIRFRLASDRSRLSDGLFGFVLPVQGLARLDNTYCRKPNQLCPRQLEQSSFLDLLGQVLQPDADVDGRAGRDRVELGPDGRVGRCLDDGEVFLAPYNPAEPWSCALRPEMGDGYSIAFDLSGIRASIGGIAMRDRTE